MPPFKMNISAIALGSAHLMSQAAALAAALTALSCRNFLHALVHNLAGNFNYAR